MATRIPASIVITRCKGNIDSGRFSLRMIELVKKLCFFSSFFKFTYSIYIIMAFSHKNFTIQKFYIYLYPKNELQGVHIGFISWFI